jgi:hypothetical protein
MANKIMVTGKSGSGKTYSLRTLDPASTFIICPDEKNPPFKGWRKNYTMTDPGLGRFSPTVNNYYKTTDWNSIQRALNFVSDNRPEIKTIVIDTITYAMIGEFMGKATVKGYDKFTEMGSNVYQTLKMIDGLRDDLTVIVMAHTEKGTFNGVDTTEFGVPGGKLVKDVVKPEGMFVITLETIVEKVGDVVKYSFMTQNNTTNMAKSPIGMFPSKTIDNDMKMVLDCIKLYEEGE